VGDVISTESGFLRGHGTTVRSDGKLIATVSGFIERVNKLISVRPLNSRYQPETGDVVVGRIVEVADKKWRVDILSRQHASLLLSSINLPGGVQRRRTVEDSLQMRRFFVENDLISAEVQNSQSDGSISLQTRSLKYGKLENGMLIRVRSSLIKRSKQHFVTLPCGVDLILGLNGFIFLSPTPNSRDTENTLPTTIISANESESLSEKKQEQGSVVSVNVSRLVLEKMSRVRNSIICLSRMFMAIYPQTIMDVYEESVGLNLSAKQLLNPDIVQRVTQPALNRIAS